MNRRFFTAIGSGLVATAVVVSLAACGSSVQAQALPATTHASARTTQVPVQTTTSVVPTTASDQTCQSVDSQLAWQRVQGSIKVGTSTIRLNSQLTWEEASEGNNGGVLLCTDEQPTVNAALEPMAQTEIASYTKFSDLYNHAASADLNAVSISTLSQPLDAYRWTDDQGSQSATLTDLVRSSDLIAAETYTDSDHGGINGVFTVYVPGGGGSGALAIDSFATTAGDSQALADLVVRGLSSS